MSVCCSPRLVVALAAVLGCAATGQAAQPAAELAPVSGLGGGLRSADLPGIWEISVPKTGETCRLMLRSQQAPGGAYFIGFSPACRHSMPELAKVGHWTMPDSTHLDLTDSTGTVTLAAAGDAFTATAGDRAFMLKRVATVGSAGGFAPVESLPSSSGFATIVPISKRSKAAAAEPQETSSDLGGRYAVMREKRDTGCMLTLDDKSRVKGGDRAQLAPGCRDQGIVIFDPTAWAIVKGELVLTARAGHKARLVKSGEGSWQKDPKDGGKPLGLKKL